MNYNLFSNFFKKFIRNFKNNEITDRYFIIKGMHIDAKFEDILLSCLFIDVLNILSFYKYGDEYSFRIFNFPECNNTLYGEFYIGFEINYHINKVPHNFYKIV